jgi:hypothetical protein
MNILAVMRGSLRLVFITFSQLKRLEAQKQEMLHCGSDQLFSEKLGIVKPHFWEVEGTIYWGSEC